MSLKKPDQIYDVQRRNLFIVIQVIIGVTVILDCG